MSHALSVPHIISSAQVPSRKSAVVTAIRPHFRTDNAMVDHYLELVGPIGFTLYSVLQRYTNRVTGVCWPSLATLAKKIGITKPTVLKYLRLLRKYGLISWEERYDDAGEHHSHLYTVHPALPPEGAIPPDRLPGAEMDGGGKTDLPGGKTDPPGGSKTALPEQDPEQEKGTSGLTLSALQNQPSPLSTLDRSDSPAYARLQEKQQRCDHPLPSRVQHADGSAYCGHCWCDQLPVGTTDHQPAAGEVQPAGTVAD
jgi:hypothetical protein